MITVIYEPFAKGVTSGMIKKNIYKLESLKMVPTTEKGVITLLDLHMKIKNHVQKNATFREDGYRTGWSKSGYEKRLTALRVKITCLLERVARSRMSCS